MEVACGEYGDMVPRLVVAVRTDQCSYYQRHRKLTNCEKDLVQQCRPLSIVSTNKWPELEAVDAKETAILDDTDDENLKECAAANWEEQELKTVKTCNRAGPVHIVINGETVLTKDVCLFPIVAEFNVMPFAKVISLQFSQTTNTSKK